MGKNQSASNLPNIIQYSNGSINFVSGSTLLMQISSSGAITTTGVISGSNALSSSYAVNSDQLDGFDSTAFVFTSSFNTYSSSMSTRTSNLESTGSTLTTASASFAVVSSSYSSSSGSLSTRVTKIEGNYATTGSNVFLGAQTVCANITSTGTIIAQTLNVQQVTSSIVYSSGSNTFGCLLTDRQQFTGSVLVTGSLTVTTAGTSPEFQVATTGTTIGNALTDTHQVTGSVLVTGSLNVAGNTCVVSICSPSFIGGVVSGTTLCTSNGVIGNNSNHLYLSSNSTTGEISFWANQLNTRLMTITSCGCVGIGTNSPSSTYGRLTVAGTGISIADDGNAKLQIGRFNSANCNAYIKMGINTCSLRFTNPGDTVDVVTFDKGGSVLIGTTATPVGKLDVATGGNTNVVISNDSTDTGYNIISLNGTRTKGSYAGIAGGGTGDDRLYLNSGVEVVIQTGASYTARMRTYATGPTCFSCPISITGAGSGIALNFGNSVANNILYINSYGGWSGIGMDATSATMRIAGDITEPNGIVQFGYYKGGTLNNACWCQKAVILTTGIGCFANTVCAPTFRGGSSLQLGGYAFQFTAAKNFNENTSDVEFFKIAMGGGQAAIFVNFSSYNSGTAAYKMQTYHGLLSNNWTGWVGCGIEVTGNPSCRANFAASSINSIATYSGCLVFRVSTTNNGTSTQATGTANILVVTDGTVPTFTQL